MQGIKAAGAFIRSCTVTVSFQRHYAPVFVTSLNDKLSRFLDVQVNYTPHTTCICVSRISFCTS